VHGRSFDLAFQPLDGMTKLSVGAPWIATNVAISADGRFAADFGTQPVPPAAYPLLDDPVLTVHECVLSGATTSSDGFCGAVGDCGQVFGTEPSDGCAVRITGDPLPTPVAICSQP
jgi:hypothetical protein